MPAAVRAGPDRGAVTVEAAIGLCALTVVFGLLIAAVTAVSGQLRCVDAAREAARLIARGQRPLAEQAVTETAPAGARLTVRIEGETAIVEVTADPVGGLLPGVRLRGRAFTVLEPGGTGTARAPG
ncbi:pilus assembly protein [Amycolatopsis cynarae]|uniref:Pilus assembly protein n=1 Tax=Amycolatopsis cynarae TaxID=2995223 RepID=A0ABY7B4B7_9PSEU|nr:TadE family type IV pilus minor pilin [Amycolatopsis sp. HUAS 11-8]WAL66082.1 pilus assembly protein [Amycolatopsis sp. HUAS 11-8]